MNHFSRLTGLAVTLLASMLLISPASAQATRTWISGVGDDANPCSRTAPCKTFAGAISKTAAGGEIDVLDPGGFGAVTITKSITLDGGGGIGGQVGSILVSGTNGINVNAASTDWIKIRNMTINGIAKSSGPGLSGIKFNTGAALIVEHVGIFGCGGTPDLQGGVDFQPQATSSLFMLDTEVQNCLSDGILIKPTSTGTAKATLTRVSTLNNGNGVGFGLRVDTVNVTSGTAANVTVNGSTFAGSVDGIAVLSNSAGATSFCTVTNSVAANNSAAGVIGNGTHVNVAVGGSTLSGNGGKGMNFVNSASVLSFQDNYEAGNGTMPSTPSGTIGKI